MAEKAHAKPPTTDHGPRPLLRHADQAAVATLVLFAIVGLAAYWFVQGGHRGELIVIDRAELLTARYLVDINAAEWPDNSTLKVLADLIFEASELPEVPFDSRATPGVDAAAQLLGKWLASGPRHYRQILTNGLKAGLSAGNFYRAKRRLGITHAAGQWSLA